jgi:hypothetical protein
VDIIARKILDPLISIEDQKGPSCNVVEIIEVIEDIEWCVKDNCANNSGCCFVEHPAGEITMCSNTASPHRFCFGCAKRNAETEIGKGKYARLQDHLIVDQS